MRGWLSPDRALQLVESALDRGIGTLHHKAQAFEVQIGEFGPVRPMPSASSESWSTTRQQWSMQRGSRTTRTWTTSSRPEIAHDAHFHHFIDVPPRGPFHRPALLSTICVTRW